MKNNIHIELFLDNTNHLRELTRGPVGDVLVNLAQRQPSLHIAITNHADIPKNMKVVIVGPNSEKVADELEKRNQPYAIINKSHDVTDNMKRIEEFVLNPV